jgi:formiminoglutamate deiminase
MEVVASWARDRQAPLHLHLSEQLAENQACLAATGLSPTGLAEQVGALGPRTTAVHAIHLSPDDVRRLGSSQTAICVCPSTERDLGDGVCPAAELSAAGSPLCLGTDSNAVVDIFEEARAVELDQRLVTQRRGLHTPESLLRAATAGGATALGWGAGELRVGAAADFVSLDLESPRLAGPSGVDLLARVVFAAAPSDVRSTVVGGRPIVEDGRHLRLGGVGSLLAQALQSLEEMV